MSYFPALLTALLRRTPPPVPPQVPLDLMVAGWAEPPPRVLTTQWQYRPTRARGSE